ncbi:MAG: ECF transporter S component, partial [Eubacteriales bacterium]
IGSALADLFLGYPVYIPGTFVIKGLSALLASVLCASFCRVMKNKTLPPLLASLVAEAEMVAGYFAYAAIVRGKGLAAAASIPGNLAQGAAGIIVFMLCFVLFEKYHLKDRLLRRYSGDT